MNRLLHFDEITQTANQARIAKIDAFRDSWELSEALTADTLQQLQQLATMQSVGSSTRIEGVTMGDEEIARLIKEMEIRKLVSRDEQEVAGYFTTLQLILDSYPHITLTENTIKGLHKQLLQFSDKDTYHQGEYKTLSNQVVATLPSGEQKIIFRTTDPARVNDAMRKLITWTDREITGSTQHRLLVIGTFVYEFLTIHPFQDGNGRLSRLLTTLLLLRNGYEFIQYVSLEREIEKQKAKYYQSLMHAQRKRDTEQEVIGRWMSFFLEAIYQLTLKLQERQQEVAEPAALYLNKRQRIVLEYIRKHGATALKDVEARLPDESRSTLKYDLKRLYEAGYLERKGKGRGTVYL